MAHHPKKTDRPYKGGLPSLDVRIMGALDTFRPKAGGGEDKIPNASLIYGVAASILFAIALYNFFTGVWFTGLLLLVLAVALFGYALVYLRFSE